MLIKILHMIFASLTVLLFVVRVALSWSSDGQLQGGVAKLLKVLPHIAYTGLVVFGLWMMALLPVYPHWMIAKLVLFAVAVSASLKAFRPTASRAQFRAGVLVAAVAYAAIVWLIVAKPGGLYQPKAVAAAISSTSTGLEV